MSSQKKLHTFGNALPHADSVSSLEDWQQARPAWIRGALEHSQSLADPGWYVLDAVRHFDDKPRLMQLNGQELVVWRGADGFVVAPDSCPHMGASLATGHVCDGNIVCPWHGLQLGSAGHGAWKPLPVYDDGVLLWVAPHTQGTNTPRADGPVLAPRPARFLDAVVRSEYVCDPQDIIANRLDPWHGAHYHPYSFGRLRVIEQSDEDIIVRVVYRVVGSFGVEVDARFHCPEPRTIVMTIVRGEGEGSVVETHATPLAPGRTAMIEATLATSHRPQFWGFIRLFGRVMRPLVRKAAARLWVDDGAYAERLYTLRQREAAATPRSSDPTRSV